jgi:peptide chain release factor 3
MAEEFRGVIDRRDGSFHRFRRTAGGATPAGEERPPADASDPLRRTAGEELALVDAAGARLDVGEYLAGRATPVYFGSALSNFGVRLLLNALTELAPSPGARVTVDGGRRALDEPFSGQVFKLQANLDPRHRDRLAFVRVCSGRFKRGMKATNARTGRPIRFNYAHELFGQDRQTLDEAHPGDVVGLINNGDLRIGDTLYGAEPVCFPPFPILAPELFAHVRNLDTRRYKQFHRGLAQLRQEGVVHVLHRVERDAQDVILAGIGPMQFEVTSYRMTEEFGAEIALDPAKWVVSRRTNAAGAQVLGRRRAQLLTDEAGTILAAFGSRFELERFMRDEPNVLLDPFLVGS